MMICEYPHDSRPLLLNGEPKSSGSSRDLFMSKLYEASAILMETNRQTRAKMAAQ